MTIGSVHRTDPVERNGLSVLTFWLRPIEAPRIRQVWKARSQPARLLAVSIAIMTCLCGSIYMRLTTQPLDETAEVKSASSAAQLALKR